MKRYWFWILLFAIPLFIKCEAVERKTSNTMYAQIQIGEKTYSLFLHDTPTTEALMKKLPLTLEMQDLYHHEKYVNLPDDLPSVPLSIKRVKSGDLMLYGSDCLVLFYRNFDTSFRYTVLGQIEDAENLSEIVGDGNIQITLKSTQKENSK